MGLFQEFVDELNRAYIQWELEYRQNARLAKLALTTWWDGLWARMPEVDWQRELDEFQAEWLERGIRINAADAERMRAYLRDWQAESQKRADQSRRAEEAAALQFDQAQPLADGGVAIPFNAALAEQIADRRWYELLAQIAQLIYRYSPPEAWVGEAERIVSAAGAPPKWRRWFIEQIERAQRWRLERDRRPKEWLDAFAEAEHERRRAEAELDRQRESRLWRFAKAIDEYVASGSPGALVAVFRELIDALPDQVPSALIGGEAQQLLQSAQRLLHSVADFIEALPPEAAAVGLDLLQLALDLVGLIPGFGEPADAINAAISFRRREYLDAALGAASLLPLGGQLPGAAKILRRLDRIKKLIAKFGGALGAILRRLAALLVDEVGRFISGVAHAIRYARDAGGAIYRFADEWLKHLVSKLDALTEELLNPGVAIEGFPGGLDDLVGPVEALRKRGTGATGKSARAPKRRVHLPSNKKGTWQGERGNSEFKPHDPKHFGLEPDETIPFEDAWPNFSKWSKDAFSVEGLNGYHDHDMPKIWEYMADNRGFPSAAAARRWLSEQDLIPHHAGGAVVQLIPGPLHRATAHTGGAWGLRNSF